MRSKTPSSSFHDGIRAFMIKRALFRSTSGVDLAAVSEMVSDSAEREQSILFCFSAEPLALMISVCEQVCSTTALV